MKPSVPYGYAIAAGALVAWPESWWARVVPF
jgi:Flp pilus assembly protein protease CpaA